MQIKEIQEIGIEKSFGLTHPGQTMLNQTLVLNSLHFKRMFPSNPQTLQNLQQKYHQAKL